MSRIAVTGSRGRLGRSVVDVLAEAGHEVVGMDRAAPDASAPEHAPSSEFIAADLTDAARTAEVFAAARVDAVVHLAAIAVPFSAPEPEILRTNAALAFNVMHCAAEAGVRKIVTASSPTVYGYGAPGGWRPERLPLDERVVPRPWNAYALSKLVAERTMEMIAVCSGGSVHTAAFRPCYVIAPEEWRGAPTQQGHTVRERLDDPALSAPALFNYVDARDVGAFLDTLLGALGEIPDAQTFNVGAADALARRPLAELMPEFVPGIGDAASRLTDARPAFSIEKARRLLGWEPARGWRGELGEDEAPQAGARAGEVEDGEAVIGSRR